MDKWEAVKEVLTSPNAWMFLLFVIFVLFVLNRMAKSGLLSFKGKGLRVGSDETERTIIREQSKWAYLFIMAIKGKVLTEDATEAQNERAELLLYKVYVKVIDWINYNHISANNSYVEIKQGEIIGKNIKAPFLSAEVRGLCPREPGRYDSFERLRKRPSIGKAGPFRDFFAWQTRFFFREKPHDFGGYGAFGEKRFVKLWELSFQLGTRPKEKRVNVLARRQSGV
jgi:hypothetical protein